MTERYQAEIKRLLSWFAIFSYPLTAEEIWHYFPEAISLADLKSELETWPNSHGYYFLPGSEELAAVRQKRQAGFFKKLRRAKVVGWYLAHLPFVRGVFLANLIGSGNLRRESDLDFLVVADDRRLWLARLLAALPFKILGLRPKIGDKQDKICLSFYLNARELDLTPLMLPEDPYFKFWLAGLLPLYDSKNIYGALWQDNPVLAHSLPNIKPLDSEFRAKRKSYPAWNFVDKVLGSWQQTFMPAVLKDRAVICRQALKFYLSDRRSELAEKYKQLA